MSTTERLIDRVVTAARRVEFWSSNGIHGDGNLTAAKRELATARRELATAMNTPAVIA